MTTGWQPVVRSSNVDVGIAVGSRGNRAALGAVSRPRQLARPTGLPRSSQTQVSEVFVLAKLTPNEGDLSVKHLGGVRRPAPSAGSCLGRGQETRAQRGFVLRAGSGVATVTGFAGESGYGPCPHGPYPNTGDPRPARARSRVAYDKQLRDIKTGASSSCELERICDNFIPSRRSPYNGA